MWLVTTFLMIQDKVLKHRSLWLCITLGTEAGAERSIHAGPEAGQKGVYTLAQHITCPLQMVPFLLP